MKIILASSSRYRKELLQRIVPDFQCVAPNIDEESIKSEGISPEQVAVTLSAQKGKKVFEQFPDAIVISSDQLVSFNNKIIGKAHTIENAVNQLFEMNNKAHTLITAFHVYSPNKVFSAVDKTILHMRNLSREEIERYVQHDHPVDCAGSYKLESKGIALFNKIESEDFSAIQGLPLIKLTSFLRELEIDVF